MISETCSVCGTGFDVVFRYQMEERNGGFAFYCSQKCLEKSQKGGDGDAVNCDACAKRFTPELVSQVLYLGGKRRYACCLGCRSQLVRESQGTRLGDMVESANKNTRPQGVPAPAAMPPVAMPPVAMPPAPTAARPATPAEPEVAPPPVTLRAPASAAPPAAPAPARVPAAISFEPGPVSAPPGPVSAPPGPVSAPPPASQAGKSVPPRVPARDSKQAPSREVRQPAARSKEAPATSTRDIRQPPTRSSGLMSAIRPEAETVGAALAPGQSPLDMGRSPLDAHSSHPAQGAPGTVVPVAPPLKSEKRPVALESTAPRRIAIFNHKGGTGKTTTAVSVAAGLAAKGKRVLLVDTDAQGNVSVSLGAGSERSLYHVLVMGLRVGDAVKEVRPNLHLLPSNETLAAAELYLAGRQNRDRVLADRLSAAAADYDYVVLDCSPSLSLMNQNALVFADSVLVPVACDYLPLVGVRQVLKTVKNVNALLHHPVQIWGVLPTFFDGRAKICNEAVATLKDHFGDKCLPPIRAAIKVKEAPSVGQTIFEYAAGSNAAEDYGVIVDRIIDGVKAASPGEATREPQDRTAAAQATA